MLTYSIGHFVLDIILFKRYENKCGCATVSWLVHDVGQQFQECSLFGLFACGRDSTVDIRQMKRFLKPYFRHQQPIFDYLQMMMLIVPLFLSQIVLINFDLLPTANLQNCSYSFREVSGHSRTTPQKANEQKYFNMYLKLHFSMGLVWGFTNNLCELLRCIFKWLQ